MEHANKIDSLDPKYRKLADSVIKAPKKGNHKLDFTKMIEGLSQHIWSEVDKNTKKKVSRDLQDVNPTANMSPNSLMTASKKIINDMIPNFQKMDQNFQKNVNFLMAFNNKYEGFMSCKAVRKDIILFENNLCTRF